MKVDYESIWSEEMKQLLADDEKYGTRIKWDSVEHARKYWERTNRDKTRAIKQLSMMRIPFDGCILDIGSGPGTLSIPSAFMAKKVVCVEPSVGMCTVLKERIEEYHLSNVEVVNKKWEDVNFENDIHDKFNLVIASFSLSFTDIIGEVRRMESLCAAGGRIFLFWFIGDYIWEDSEFSAFFDGIPHKDFYPGPKTDLLFGALVKAGIKPNVISYDLIVRDEFSTPEEAAESICRRHCVPDEYIDSVAEYFRKKYGDGPVRAYGISPRAALWWGV